MNGNLENADVKHRHVDTILCLFGNNGTNGANLDRVNVPPDVVPEPVGPIRIQGLICDAVCDARGFPLPSSAPLRVCSRCGLAACRLWRLALEKRAPRQPTRNATLDEEVAQDFV